MRKAGLGALYEAFAKLKARLEAEGLFDAARKRPLPPFPRAIGIVTSPAAAALRDVLTTLARRSPMVPLVLYPAPVQGELAAAQLARAIRTANARAEVAVNPFAFTPNVSVRVGVSMKSSPSVAVDPGGP